MAWAFGVFVLIGLAQIAVGTYVLSSVAKDLKHSFTDDPKHIESNLDGYASRLAWANGVMAGPLVWAIEQVPVLGSYVQASHIAAGASARVSSELNSAVQAVGVQRLSKPQTWNAHTWRVVTGRAATALTDVGQALAELKLLPATRALPANFRAALQQAQDSGDLLIQTQRYLVAARAILGAPGKHTWFLANQNLAEARGTGGLIGSFAILQVNDGRVSLQRAGSDVDLDKVGTLLPSSGDFHPDAIWGMVNVKDWRDVNASANPSYAARQIASTWQAHTGQTIDGVIFIGQGITKLLVAATGQQVVQGVTINSGNVEMYLARDVYGQFPDPAKKNLFVKTFMHGLFARLVGGHLDLAAPGAAAAHPTTGDKLWVWLANRRARVSLAGAGLLGVLNQSAPKVTLVSLNNAGGNKLDAYIHLDSRLTVCRGSGEARLAVKLSNSAPTAGLPAYTSPRLDLQPGESRPVGSNRNLVSVYLPKRAELTGFFVDGQEQSAGDYVDSGREVLVFDLDTNPGAAHRIDVSFTRVRYAKPLDPAILQSSAQFNLPVNRVNFSPCG